MSFFGINTAPSVEVQDSSILLIKNDVLLEPESQSKHKSTLDLANVNFWIQGGSSISQDVTPEDLQADLELKVSTTHSWYLNNLLFSLQLINQLQLQTQLSPR